MSRKDDFVGQTYVAKKIHQVISILESEGWVEVRHRGSHRQFKHPDKSVAVTVAGKRSSTMTVGQLASIRRISGIEDLR